MTREIAPTNQVGQTMNDVVQSAWRFLSTFIQSDLGLVPAPLWHVMLTGQMAHILIGVAISLYRAPKALVWAVFAIWVAKEVFGDIPNAGGSWLVIADSVADLCFGALGYIITQSKLEEIRLGHDALSGRMK